MTTTLAPHPSCRKKTIKPTHDRAAPHPFGSRWATTHPGTPFYVDRDIGRVSWSKHDDSEGRFKYLAQSKKASNLNHGLALSAQASKWKRSFGGSIDSVQKASLSVSSASSGSRGIAECFRKASSELAEAPKLQSSSMMVTVSRLGSAPNAGFRLFLS